MKHTVVHQTVPNTYKDLGISQEIYVMQSSYSRAINVGSIKQNKFIPARLLLGTPRAKVTHQATVQTLNLPQFQNILKKYDSSSISSIALLREALAQRLSDALFHAGVENHYGDSFIGVTHHKDGNDIQSEHEYANIEGLNPGGLWLIADSICKARNLFVVMESLLKNNQPSEIVYISPVASRIGIKHLGRLTAEKDIPTTFFTWGALFGVDEITRYDMPWGHPDTEPLDKKDQQTFTKIYGNKLCVGGDFGNNYFAPDKARAVYEQQLVTHKITPKFPSVDEILEIYKEEEILIEE